MISYRNAAKNSDTFIQENFPNLIVYSFASIMVHGEIKQVPWIHFRVNMSFKDGIRFPLCKQDVMQPFLWNRNSYYDFPQKQVLFYKGFMSSKSKSLKKESLTIWYNNNYLARSKFYTCHGSWAVVTLTFYVLNFSEWTKTYIHILCHSSTFF